MRRGRVRQEALEVELSPRRVAALEQRAALSARRAALAALTAREWLQTQAPPPPPEPLLAGLRGRRRELLAGNLQRLAARGVSEQAFCSLAAAHFARLDTDGNRRLSVAELTGAVQVGPRRPSGRWGNEKWEMGGQ